MSCSRVNAPASVTLATVSSIFLLTHAILHKSSLRSHKSVLLLLIFLFLSLSRVQAEGFRYPYLCQPFSLVELFPPVCIIWRAWRKNAPNKPSECVAPEAVRASCLNKCVLLVPWSFLLDPWFLWTRFSPVSYTHLTLPTILRV